MTQISLEQAVEKLVGEIERANIEHVTGNDRKQSDPYTRVAFRRKPTGEILGKTVLYTGAKYPAAVTRIGLNRG